VSVRAWGVGCVYSSAAVPLETTSWRACACACVCVCVADQGRPGAPRLLESTTTSLKLEWNIAPVTARQGPSDGFELQVRVLLRAAACCVGHVLTLLTDCRCSGVCMRMALPESGKQPSHSCRERSV
jgi:hypothetical protein